MLDMTLSVVAGGKIAIKAARDEEMPDGWMIDSEGQISHRSECVSRPGGRTRR